MIRRLSGVLVAVTLLLPLAGCGGDDIDSYCSDLEEHDKQIADMIESGGPLGLLDNLPMLHDLAEHAPADLTDEWQVFNDALDGLAKALKDADVKASDFQDGKPPAGLDAADQKSIAGAASRLATDDVVQASAGIEQQARDVCKVNLGLG
jgi:hypothetical protein